MISLLHTFPGLHSEKGNTRCGGAPALMAHTHVVMFPHNTFLPRGNHKQFTSPQQSAVLERLLNPFFVVYSIYNYIAKFHSKTMACGMSRAHARFSLSQGSRRAKVARLWSAVPRRMCGSQNSWSPAM